MLLATGTLTTASAQFLYIDLFIIIPIAVASALTSVVSAWLICGGVSVVGTFLHSLAVAFLGTVGRTLPFERIHPKRPTASLMSKKVLSSIIGQIVLTSAVQFWAFFWVRAQAWSVL